MNCKRHFYKYKMFQLSLFIIVSCLLFSCNFLKQFGFCLMNGNQSRENNSSKGGGGSGKSKNNNPPLTRVCGQALNNSTTTANCIMVFEDFQKNLFTSSPTEAFVKSFGLQDKNDHTAIDGYDSHAPDQSKSRRGGGYQGIPVAAFNGYEQAEKWCQILSINKIAGRTDWSLPTSAELVAFWQTYSVDLSTKNWYTYWWYWTSETDGSERKRVSLDTGGTDQHKKDDNDLVACISKTKDNGT